MAQKVQILLTDDIDGSDASRTIEFSFDGASYEIDLSEKNEAALRNALADYIASARKVGGRRSGGAGKSKARSSSGGPAASEIREWARANGMEVPERGRVSAEVRQAYEAAH
uniref:Histone protein Lsr2 n=1 Tax=uncultured Nocardioidaceae bacterium TaxID=253824 RepID=A0A6J4LVJ9_9ACTN|nr:MAG: Histone protein Lsr2 [uncultured Nocardioidaceae bacterium]